MLDYAIDTMLMPPPACPSPLRMLPVAIAILYAAAVMRFRAMLLLLPIAAIIYARVFYVARRCLSRHAIRFGVGRLRHGTAYAAMPPRLPSPWLLMPLCTVCATCCSCRWRHAFMPALMRLLLLLMPRHAMPHAFFAMIIAAIITLPAADDAAAMLACCCLRAQRAPRRHAISIDYAAALR